MMVAGRRGRKKGEKIGIEKKKKNEVFLPVGGMFPRP